MVASFPERPVRPRSRQGDPEEEKCIGYCEGIQQKTREKGTTGGDASLYEGGYSPRELAGSRWLGMVKTLRKESGIAAGQKRKVAKAAASSKPAKNVLIQKRSEEPG